MKQFFFFFKTILFTFFLAILLQVIVDNRPLEAHLMQWVATSPILEPMKSVSNSAVTTFRAIWQEVNSRIQARLNNTGDKEKNRLQLELKRSKEFLQEQGSHAKNKLEESWQSLSTNTNLSEKSKNSSSK
ncbi:MAG: hypothetical protein IPL83_18670 [Bdellovibrionales bacterium]|jgi:hypothetical protein|nr:hypothetical protein [Bdellovibrionales bacterium]